jgi:hypothetical protein
MDRLDQDLNSISGSLNLNHVPFQTELPPLCTYLMLCGACRTFFIPLCLWSLSHSLTAKTEDKSRLSTPTLLRGPDILVGPDRHAQH